MSRRRTAAAALLLVLVGCGGPDPAEVADDNPELVSCLEVAEADLEGSGDWSAAEAQEFWATPGTLDCAVDTLDDEELTEVLEPAFPELDFDDDGYLDQLTAQLQVLADWAAGTAAEVSLDETLPRAARVLGSTPARDSGYDFSRALVTATALGAMRGAGDYPSYDAYLADHPDDTDTAELMVRVSSGDNISEEDRLLLEETRAALVDQL